MGAMTQEDSQAGFDARHEKDLSAGTFGKTIAFQTFMPLAATAVGGAIGYFALPAPLRKMFPKFFAGASHVEGLVAHFNSKGLAAVPNLIQEAFNVAPDVLARMRGRGIAIELNMDSARNFLKEASMKELETIEGKLGITIKEDSRTAKWTGAAILGIPSMMAAGLFNGYTEWRKERSAQLAAAEVNDSLSKLEIMLPPSAPELEAEVKVQREMFKAASAKGLRNIEHQGMAKHGAKKESVELEDDGTGAAVNRLKKRQQAQDLMENEIG